MASQGNSTGADMTVVVQTAKYGRLVLGQMLSFTSKETVMEKTETLMNGRNVNNVFSQGYDGTFTMLRNGNQVSDYFKKLSKDRKLRKHEVGDTIICTIREASGAITRNTYTECKMILTESGAWNGTEHVKQTIGFKASDMD